MLILDSFIGLSAMPWLLLVLMLGLVVLMIMRRRMGMKLLCCCSLLSQHLFSNMPIKARVDKIIKDVRSGGQQVPVAAWPKDLRRIDRILMVRWSWQYTPVRLRWDCRNGTDVMIMMLMIMMIMMMMKDRGASPVL